MEENAGFIGMFLAIIAAGVIHIVFPSFINEINNMFNVRWRLREHSDNYIRMLGVIQIITAVIIAVVLAVPK